MTDDFNEDYGLPEDLEASDTIPPSQVPLAVWCEEPAGPTKKRQRAAQLTADRSALLRAAVDSLNAVKEPIEVDECRAFGLLMESAARGYPHGPKRSRAMLAAHQAFVDAILKEASIVQTILLAEG